MVYITGDTHGHFERIFNLCEKMDLTNNDTMIILGDVGLNFFLNKSDRNKKKNLSLLPINFFCIHGNHEVRPQNIEDYIEDKYWGGKVLIQPEFPNIKFAIDGEIYDIPTSKGIKKSIVIGGAYSVDKYYRLYSFMMNHTWEGDTELVEKLVAFMSKWNTDESYKELFDKTYKEKNLYDKCYWWPDEQPNQSIKDKTEKTLSNRNWNIDLILTHTCPLKYEPIEVFLSGINQNTVDKSTEIWLDQIENKLNYEKWYCGHYHTSKKIDKIQFMFEDFDIL